MSGLEGLRVLELADDVTGAFVGSILVQLGAEVLKVEPPGGDPLRRTRTGQALFAHLNAGKRGLTLDPGRPEGREVLTRLLTTADLVVRSSNEPAYMAHVHDLLAGGRAAVCCVTPFGETGPRATYRATPLIVDHAGGEGYMLPGGREYLGSPPARAGWQASEYDAGWHAAIALLACLLDPGRDAGRPQHIDLSKQEATAACYAFNVTNYLNDGTVPSRHSTAIGVGGCLPCRDGYVQVFAPDEAAWRAVLKVLGDPEWAADRRFATVAGREEHKDELNLLMLGVLVELPRQEILARALAHGAPIGVYQTPPDLLASEQLQARDAFRRVAAPGLGTLLCPRLPWETPSEPEERRIWDVPAPGEANAEIYGALGWDGAALRALASAGAI